MTSFRSLFYSALEKHPSEPYSSCVLSNTENMARNMRETSGSSFFLALFISQVGRVRGEVHSKKPSLYMQCFSPVLPCGHLSCNPSQQLHPWKQ